MKVPLFTGSATALVTPFGENGIDYEKTARLIDWQAESGTSALVVCGTTGEAATLTEQEHDALVEFCVRHTAGRMKIIAGIGSNNTLAACRAAEKAAAAGADGTLLTTPYYNKANRAGLAQHFLQAAEASPLPLIVYNVPSRTSVSCTAELYAELAAHPRINGVKEASGDLSLVSRTRRLCGDELNIWCGNDDQTLPMMALGALGVISVASNVIPGPMSELCDACLQGDFAQARRIHSQYAELFEALFWEVNPIPVNTAMNLMGVDVGSLRLPLCEMSPSGTQALYACLKKLKLAA